MRFFNFNLWKTRPDRLPRQARDKQHTANPNQNNNVVGAVYSQNRVLPDPGRLRDWAVDEHRVLPWESGSKTVFLAIYVHLKMMILPRQARDKHRENSKTDYRFPSGLPLWTL